MPERLLNLQTLYSLVDYEPYGLLFFLVVLCWVIYKVFLRQVSEERHRNINTHLSHLFRNFLFLSVLFVTFLAVYRNEQEFLLFQKIAPYLALVSLFWGMIVLVRACRLLVLQYLFMGSMRAGVPLLLVNMFSLLLSIVLIFWMVSKIFGVQVGPLLATSAAFSVILGLAMQDTLGNLFAGLSLQIDKSYEIGDWLEVTNGSQKVIGQVKEISWRSTLLVGFSEELTTLPNRWMAQSQISNYSPPEQPIVRSQVFRLSHGSPIDKAREILEGAAGSVEDVRSLPAPSAFVSETTESWITVKLIYFIDSYGAQFVIGDRVLRSGIESLAKNGIDLARTHIKVDTKSLS